MEAYAPRPGVFASEGSEQPSTLHETGASGDDATLALACDPEEGFCAGGGFRSRTAFLRVYHPDIGRHPGGTKSLQSLTTLSTASENNGS